MLDTTDLNGTPVENRAGPADNTGRIAANKVNPALPLIDPTGG